MPMEFRLYRSETPGETSPLWGRRVPVRFDENGMFYVELCDGAGAEVSRAEKAKLADAIAAAEGNALGNRTLIGKFRRLEIADGIDGSVGHARNRHAPINIGKRVFSATDGGSASLLLHGEVPAVMSMGSMENNRVPVKSCRFHNGIAHIVGNRNGQCFRIKLHDDRLVFPIRNGNAYNFHRIKNLFGKSFLKVSRHVHT
jgi:hypothetical protein